MHPRAFATLAPPTVFVAQMLPMGLRERIYYRAKRIVERENYRQALERNNLSAEKVSGISLEMIEMLETTRHFHKRANVLVDIGTHKGLFSRAAGAFYSWEQIVCVEPNAEMNDHIRKNVSHPALTIENIALSEGEGEVDFFLHEDTTMNSIVEADAQVLRTEFPFDNPDRMGKTRVRTRTLDAMVHDLHLRNPVFFLKIDTQGNELHVLRHGSATLALTEMCLIEFMFTTPYRTDFAFYDLVSFMQAHGFECQGALSIKKRPSKKVSAVDFLFVRRSDA